MRQRWVLFVVAAISMGLIVAFVIGIIAVRTALIAEENLQAFFHAHRATIEFIQQNDGRWPESWDDLRSIRPESDFEWVADHLTYDFDADPIKIISQTPQNFTAIKPAEPCYIIDDKVELLIDTLKKYHQER